ncbi:MAG: helix-turn-helix transcriptional regulator [Polaromonas sp.]|nr:helix-turn-helix transcriptional regulator [Polaromonas sp.]
MISSWLHLLKGWSLLNSRGDSLTTAAIGEQTLSRMGSPIFLVDSSCQIGVANDEAQELLDKGAHGGLLQQVEGKLTCANAQANSELRDALYELGLDNDAPAVDTVQRDRAFVRVQGVRGEPNSALVLCLLALRPEATMGAFGRKPLAMVLVHDPAYRRQLDPFMVAAAYGLSPAEAKVAMALASGLVPKRIALNHSVSIETIRTQMKTLYRKLEVNSAIELAAMLNTAPFAFLG